ncbi:cytochrome P450 [Annulohypoxylon truncatum]|uniref:cytochrome P450 n=1 Tax=Annulohypoxylon truncatum TaxID=327061 RepID=UPI002007C2E8|nr:cytochrome P450 [Annulohypoxylon truncatum]KAI1207267.1 cytochrome P450 [Annulohypoxylon truncatum]
MDSKAPSVASMASTYGVYIVTALVLLIPSYYLILHPLSRYPGPLIAKFTNGYGAFYALKGTFHSVTCEQHRKYGPVIRQGPNKLVFNTVTALKDIYQNERLTKPINYLSNQASPGLHNTWNALDRKMHRQRRKLTGPSINERSMRTFEPTMMNEVNTFIEQIALSQDRPIDMQKRCGYLGVDIVCQLSFGFALNSQTEEKYRFLPGEITAGNRRLYAYMQVPTIAKHRLQVLINLLWAKSREKVFRLLEHMIKSRMAQDQRAKHDMYSFVAAELKAEESSKSGSLRVNDLWMEAILFTVAGGDTTSTAIAATLFYVARHRDVYDKLAAEIRSAFGDGSEICGSKLASCHYLRACVDEALRMSPPVAGVLWRELASDEDASKPLVVDGHVIPKGTYDYFPDPFTYKPERWTSPNGEDGAPGSRKVMYDAFAPFSVGSRGCAGKAMAYLEINLTIAKSLWYYDFKPAPGKLGDIGLSDKGEFRIYDIFISTHDGPWLVFTPRSTLDKDFPDLKRGNTE